MSSAFAADDLAGADAAATASRAPAGQWSEIQIVEAVPAAVLRQVDRVHGFDVQEEARPQVLPRQPARA